METNLEEKNLSEDEKIKVNERFQRLSKSSTNEIMGSMFQLFSVHDIIMGGMQNIDKDFIKRAISSEKYVLSDNKFNVLDNIETYDFTKSQKEFLRGIIDQEQAVIDMLDDECKKIS